MRSLRCALGAAALVAATLGSAGASAAAAGAVTIGQPADNPISCDGTGAHPTILQYSHSISGADYTAHSAGVITSFSSWQNASSFRGLVLRPAATPLHYSLVGKSAAGSSAGPGAVTVPTRIPVLPGDKIALQVLTPGAQSECYLAEPTDDETQEIPASTFDPDGAAADADFSGASPVSNQGVDLWAQLEPDADGDGYGDVTQDLCPSSATQHTACATSTRPDTVLVGKVKKKVAKHGVTLKFGSLTAGATFRCQVDKKAAKACTSPYRHSYKTGKHTVTVTAIDPATGLSDPTPLVVHFKVKPKRHGAR